MDVRKRGRDEIGFNANGSAKKSKQEFNSLSTGVGSKSKPCTKFFSTAGCPFGESCHFLHYVPGGYNAVSQMMNLAPAGPVASRNVGIAAAAASVPNGSPGPVKTRLCNKHNTAEGCKFGSKCHFAHGEWELGRPVSLSHDDPRAGGPIPGRMLGRMEPPVTGAAASFGFSSAAKISVASSLAGAIIGKGGVNSKLISRQTGAKLSVREHESDPNLRQIELEGTFEQIKEAESMVRELISSVMISGHVKASGPLGASAPRGSNFKTKLCDNFAKGSCTFGERCHFAHGAAELRTSGV